MTVLDYNACVDGCADGLFRFMLKSVHDRQMAEDLVQDAFEKLWVRHEQVEAEKSKSYLFTVAYHAMIDRIRKEKRLTAMDLPGVAAPSHTHHYSDLNEALHRALAQLPVQQQTVVLLRDYEGYSYEEIGQITGLNPSQVKTYIYRARMSMKEYIGSMDQVI